MKELSQTERALVLDPRPVPENYTGLIRCTQVPPCGHCYYCQLFEAALMQLVEIVGERYPALRQSTPPAPNAPAALPRTKRARR